MSKNVIDNFMVEINLLEMVANVPKYLELSWDVKPDLDITLLKLSCLYRPGPNCFGSEAELIIWWYRETNVML